MAVLLVAAVTLAGLEMGLRVAMPGWNEYFSGRFMTQISYPGYPNTSLGRPGFDGYFSQNNGDFRSHIHINEFGLRNDESVAAADGRVWVLGDSFSFGWGVERDETYTALLARFLDRPTYNIASPGSGVCAWQTLTARMPKDARPLAVVVGLTVENRVGPMDCAAEARLAAGAVQEEPRALGVTALKMYMTEHLALYNFFTVVLKRIDLAAVVLEKLGVINDARLVDFHNTTPETLMSGLSSTATELVRLRAMLPPDTPFVVAVIPTRFEVRDDLGFHRDLRLGVEAEMAKQGIDYVDMIDVFKAAGHDATSFPHDGHWTPRGHAIAARAIADWMIGHGKTPG
ncbi:MAG: hypothetical protein Q7R40_12450 [Phaeospirillum sp.]|nr:hypothetical protein [Phaeospirillum sp.]